MKHSIGGNTARWRLSAVVLISTLVYTVFGARPSSASDNWPRFRGSDATGVAEDDTRLPETWSQSENVAWKTEIPGWGWSSPVVWGNKVFLTTVVSDKQEENESPRAGLYLGRGRRNIPEGVHHWWVYCLDLESGTVLWKHEAHQGKPKVGRHPKSTYAAETPTTDGERLYVLFGDLGLFCYDLDGKPLWSQLIEPKKTMFDYGAAASPVVHEDQVFVVYDNQEASWMASFDTKTGQQRWRKPRDEPSTWATPFVWKNDVRTEIVVPGKKKNRSYDLEGNILWEMDGRMSNLVIPSPFVAHGMVYIASGYFQDLKRPVIAIKPGAKGDITLDEDASSNEFVSWFQPKAGPYNTSPLVYRDLYYTLLDRGMMTTHDAKTGELLYDRTRFPKGASFTASPWAYNGKVFCLAEDGRTFALEAGREFKIVHTNSLDEMCMACPAVAQGRLLLRTISKLYCLTKEP